MSHKFNKKGICLKCSCSSIASDYFKWECLQKSKKVKKELIYPKTEIGRAHFNKVPNISKKKQRVLKDQDILGMMGAEKIHVENFDNFYSFYYVLCENYWYRALGTIDDTICFTHTRFPGPTVEEARSQYKESITYRK